MQTTYRVHPDTYAAHLSAFTTYDGVTVPQSHEWTDETQPRTERPVRFSKGQHHIVRGGSVVRVARLGEQSRLTMEG